MAKATNAIDAERKKEATKLRKEAEKAEKGRNFVDSINEDYQKIIFML